MMLPNNKSMENVRMTSYVVHFLCKPLLQYIISISCNSEILFLFVGKGEGPKLYKISGSPETFPAKSYTYINNINIRILYLNVVAV